MNILFEAPKIESLISRRTRFDASEGMETAYTENKSLLKSVKSVKWAFKRMFSADLIRLGSRFLTFGQKFPATWAKSTSSNTYCLALDNAVKTHIGTL